MKNGNGTGRRHVMIVGKQNQKKRGEKSNKGEKKYVPAIFRAK